jgi:quercetin dioxygenase-like cupin family protein
MNELLTFDDEAQAYAEIEAMGYHAMAFDFPAEENDFHWHDFDSVVYVTDGEITLSTEDGESITCQRGAKIVAKAGLVHREQSPGYSAIIGFAVAPETLTQPINKPLPVML